MVLLVLVVNTKQNAFRRPPSWPAELQLNSGGGGGFEASRLLRGARY